MAKTALVTGAHGFIGRHVAKHLARAGVYVTAMGHGNWSRSEWRNWGISDWQTVDISLEALSTYGGSPDLIVHCAGSGSVGYSLLKPYQDFQRTVSTTLAILEFARLQAPSAKLVLPSSAAVYGVANNVPTGEKEPVSPVSPYGVHKMLSEQLCRSYAAHFGLALCIVRLFSVYGIGLRKQLLWDACMKFQRQEPAFSGTGNEARDWICVDDAAALLFVASKHASAACPVANGGSGHSVSVAQVLNLIARGMAANCEPVFSGESRPGDPTRQWADISVATAWGWSPSIDWQIGIRDYVKWVSEGAA